jgi:hypothetical protein
VVNPALIFPFSRKVTRSVGGGRGSAVDPFSDRDLEPTCIVAACIVRSSLQLNILSDQQESMNGGYTNRSTIVGCIVRRGCLLLETGYECIEEFHGGVTPFAAENRQSWLSHITGKGDVLFSLLFNLLFRHSYKVAPVHFVYHLLAKCV